MVATTIQIPTDLRDRLKTYGIKGDTYSDIIERLLEQVDHNTFMEEHYRRLRDRHDFVSLDEA